MSTINTFKNSKTVIILIIYLSMLLDNILLTVVVPIIPDFLLSTNTYINNSQYTNIIKAINGTTFNEAQLKASLKLESDLLENENGAVGILLSSKALIQFLVNPVVGFLTTMWGYNLPIFIGTMNLLIVSILFAIGQSYLSLLIARSLHGVASACIAVASLCLTAKLETSEGPRARIIGIVLGSVALGVLVGYPLGGFLYDFIGKSAPFIFISFLIIFNLGLQLWCFNLKPVMELGNYINPRWSNLLNDPLILISAGAIWVSTSALAILEPCLPIWLMEHLNPLKWQLGTVFIPDSLGYLIGTNFFSVVAYKIGRWKVSIVAMILIGMSAFLVPTANTINQLMIPHFGLGLGIGIVDAALVPFLAHLVDSRHHAHYSAVYALQQISVSLAYSVGPIIGGQLVKTIGFSWLMRIIGLANVLYCPLLIILKQNNCKNEQKPNELQDLNTDNSVIYNSTINDDDLLNYHRFYNSED